MQNMQNNMQNNMHNMLFNMQNIQNMQINAICKKKAIKYAKKYLETAPVHKYCSLKNII